MTAPKVVGVVDRLLLGADRALVGAETGVSMTGGEVAMTPETIAVVVDAVMIPEIVAAAGVMMTGGDADASWIMSSSCLGCLFSALLCIKHKDF